MQVRIFPPKPALAQRRAIAQRPIFSGQAGYWYLQDMNTGEQWQFNPGGAAVCQLDLSQTKLKQGTEANGTQLRTKMDGFLALEDE